MIGSLVKKIFDLFLGPLNRAVSRLGITKPQINLLEALAGCGAGAVYALGWPLAAWPLLAIHSFLDYFDGGTRRTLGRSMKGYRILGWDTHVLADKTGDVAIFAGLALGGIIDPWLAIVALLSSIGLTILGQYLKGRKLAALHRSIFNRGDKLLVLMFFGLLLGYNIAVALVCCMNVILLIQRTLAWTMQLGKMATKPPGRSP